MRQDDSRRELSVTLYGQVQQEVLQATLANDYGISVAFEAPTPRYVERPMGMGEATEVLQNPANPFHATVALAIAPGAPDTGVTFQLAVDHAAAPLYLYKTLQNFEARMTDYVRASLAEGLSGWPVTDCLVTMTECQYMGSDGPPAMRGPHPTAADFRAITRVVLLRALAESHTVVCEPTLHVVLEIPQASLGTVTPVLARLGAAIREPRVHGELAVLETALPVRRTNELQRQLAFLTGGEGVMEATFAGYTTVRGERPTRAGALAAPGNSTKPERGISI